MNSFKQLKIWQRSVEIVKQVYLLTKRFPKEELYGLTAQMRRSAISIPSNIAEGFKRYHDKEYKQFLHIALGSAAELETQLVIAQELSYISKSDLEEFAQAREQIGKMTSSLIGKLK
ncbi:MAG: four helix bundle protein [Candidatus Omnitrophica bacterium]|nr:four helix bundle protein [Candidatus Omnitrophota bacterium]